MPREVTRNYYVSPEEVKRSMEWFASMSDVLRIERDNRIWVKVDGYWCTSNVDHEDD